MDIVERLKQIAHAITSGDRSELTMRYPARTASAYLSDAADEIERLRADELSKEGK